MRELTGPREDRVVAPVGASPPPPAGSSGRTGPVRACRDHLPRLRTAASGPSRHRERNRRRIAMDIEGSTALVTGANRGLGSAFARLLVERGAARVYAAARNPDMVK